MAQIKAYWRSVRPWSFTVSVIPPILGMVIALLDYPEVPVKWLHFMLTLIGCVLFHGGTNAFSDYFDFKKRVDREGTYGGSRVLVDKLMAPRELWWWSVVLFVLAGAIGIWLVLQSPDPSLMIALIIVGFVLGAFYTMAPLRLKYLALGDVGVFLAFGSLMVLGSYLVQTARFSWSPVLYALPVALLVDAILHSNNLRDIPFDAAVNIKTVPILIGEKRAQQMYYTLVVGAYVLIPVLILTAKLPWISLITFLSLPVALKLMRMVRDKNKMPLEKFAIIDGATAQLHMMFGVLLIVALLLHYFLFR